MFLGSASEQHFDTSKDLWALWVFNSFFLSFPSSSLAGTFATYMTPTFPAGTWPPSQQNLLRDATDFLLTQPLRMAGGEISLGRVGLGGHGLMSPNFSHSLAWTSQGNSGGRLLYLSSYLPEFKSLRCTRRATPFHAWHPGLFYTCFVLYLRCKPAAIVCRQTKTSSWYPDMTAWTICYARRAYPRTRSLLSEHSPRTCSRMQILVSQSPFSLCHVRLPLLSIVSSAPGCTSTMHEYNLDQSMTPSGPYCLIPPMPILIHTNRQKFTTCRA